MRRHRLRPVAQHRAHVRQADAVAEHRRSRRVAPATSSTADHVVRPEFPPGALFHPSPNLPASHSMASVALLEKDSVLGFIRCQETPAETPAPLIQRLNAELNAVLAEPDVASKLNDMGSSDVRGTPAQFRTFITKEMPYWESLVKRSGAKVD